MKNKRTLDIIHILLEHDSFMTVAQIAKKLNVSNKTIRNDLIEVEEVLKKDQIQLIKKTGSGIMIDADEDVKLHLRDLLKHQSKRSSYSKEERINYLGLKLMLQEQISVSEACEELYVSRASIHKDLNDLNKLLESKKLKLLRHQHRNVVLQGSEKNIRKAMKGFLIANTGYPDFLNIIKGTYKEPDGRILFEALDLNDDEIFEYIDIMKNSRSPYLAVLDIDELSQILTAILVMALRIKEGFLITLSDPFIEELAEKPFYPEARYLLDHIQSRYKLDIPDKEARFLQVYMLSLNNEKNIEKESGLIAKELIGFWSSKLGDDLKDDKSLLNGITNYLSSALIRMKHGISIDYPLMNDIDVLYPKTHQIVDLSSEILKKHLSCEITDEEKGVMTIYLAAAMERKKQPLQTALISTAGEGATQLLSAKIHRSFPEIALVRTFNYATLNSFKAEDYDMVLTTEKLKTKSEHIIQINPILYPEDLLRLKQIIKELDMKKNDPIKQGNVD